MTSWVVCECIGVGCLSGGLVSGDGQVDIGRKYGGRSEYKDIDSDSVPPHSLFRTSKQTGSGQQTTKLQLLSALVRVFSLSQRPFLPNNSSTKAHFVKMVASGIARTVTWGIRFFQLLFAVILVGALSYMVDQFRDFGFGGVPREVVTPEVFVCFLLRDLTLIQSRI